jgi:sodium/potassium-transporting ATPase subunit alpha
MSHSGSGSGSYDEEGSASVSHGEIELQQKPKTEYKMEGSTVTYYDNIITDFKANEAYTLGKLERMKKEADTKKKQKKGSAMADAVQKTENIRKWEDHTWNNKVLCEKHATHRTKGLTASQVSISIKDNGKNILSEKDALPWYIVFIKEMTGFFSLLLWFGSALCFLGYGIQEDKSEDQSNLYLGIVLALVTFVTGVFPFMQTSKAASLMDDFKGFIPKTADVRRDDKDITIPAEDVAVGDFIYVNAGSSVPADIVLFTSKEMKINNASLTGESDDLLRVVNPEGGTDCANIFEAPNVAFFGTQCTEGSGTGIVIRTGDNSVIGLIASLSQSAEKKETPLSMEIERFILLISAVAITLGVVFFLFGVAYGYDYITNLVFAIGIIVANVPEGLLCTVTVSLALTAQRMAKKNVLVKNLESVETLGSTSCICSDKTGTLTQNKMTLSGMFVDRKTIDCTVNMQIFNQELKAAKPLGEDAIKQVKKPSYDINNIGFQTMC